MIKIMFYGSLGGVEGSCRLLLSFLKEIIKMYLIASVFTVCPHCSQPCKEYSGK